MDPSDYEFDLPPDAERLKAIGMVAVEWSYLESVIDAAIGTLAFMESQEIVEAITTHVQFPVRLNMLATLFHLWCDREEAAWPGGPSDPSDDYLKRRADFDAMRSTMMELSGRRNFVVHSRWVRGIQGSPLTYVVQARGRLTRTSRGVPAAEIRAIAQRIATESAKLRMFFNVIEEDLHDDW